MKPKRGETAEQTIDRWAQELLMSTSGKRHMSDVCQAHEFDRALEYVEWLRRRIEVLKVHNT